MQTIKTKDITANEAKKILSGKDAPVIIDVREAQEYNVGHIPGSVNIPLGQVLSHLNQLDKAKKYLIVCRSGNRSGLATEWLNQKGFNVLNLGGGLKDWNIVN